MPYKIIFSARAKSEYRQAIKWYKNKSLQAAENFTKRVEAAIASIEEQPDFYRKTHNEFREAKAKKFPYNVIYLFDKNRSQVVITSIFHQKRDPSNKFDR